MNITNQKTHSFSRKLAKEHGDTEALLLSYLGYRISRSQHKHNGRIWHYETLDELAERYPYLSRSAINNALTRLSSSTGPLVADNFNRIGYDRTKWYAFRDNQTQCQLQKEPAYFRVIDAEKYGVIGAVLMMNLAYWVNQKRKNNPDYQYHKLSPTTLATILPYSESAIKRALKSLTNSAVKVLLTRRPEDNRGASEYAFADEKELVNYGNGTGSNLDSSSPVLNMDDANLDMSGSNVNTEGSEVDMHGPNVNNNTILIDNCLEALCLKEEDLKTKEFKSACVSDSFSSSNGSNQNEVSTATLGKAPNSFPELVESETNVAVETKLADQSFSTSVPSSVISAPLPASVSFSEPSSKPASLLFLNPEVNGKNFELIRLLVSLNGTEDMRLGIAELAVEVIGELAKTSKVQDLYYFVKLPNQREMEAALVKWAAPFFKAVYEQRYSKPESADNDEFREMFLNFCQRILSMAYYNVKFPDRGYYIGQSFGYRASLNISSIINPWLEEQIRLQQIEDIKRRAIEFKSQDQHLESDPNLSASEKMQVFVQSLMVRNKIGEYERGKLVQQVVRYDQTTKKLVREFFQTNLQFTVQHLNLILDECVKLPADYFDDDADPQWHARNGRDITKFIRSLDIIAGQLNVLDKVPAIVPLPPYEAAETKPD